MDLSKLPRLSETDKHGAPPPPEEQQPAYRPAPVVAAGGEVWFSIVIGLILQLLSARFWSFIGSSLFGSEFTYSFSDEKGAPMSYVHSVFFLGDLAMVLFGTVLILEGVVIGLARKPALVMLAFVLTVLATLFNLYFVISMMSRGYGLQLMSALAVAFGGYIAIFEWRMLQTINPPSRL